MELTSRMRFNYKLITSFLGTNYNGWQRQKNGIGIQQVIEDRLSGMFGEKITLIGCCRTDAGVHAIKHVSNFKTISFKEPREIKKYLNATLPRDIAVMDVEEVDITFNSRFSAKGKTYLYIIYIHPDPFLFGRGWYVEKKLDIQKMLQGIEVLKKHKNLLSLSKKGEYLREDVDLREVRLCFDGKVIQIEITASHFLRGLVRGIVGHLVAIGKGSISVEEFDKIIQENNPEKGKFSAPAEGLFLKDIYY